MNDLNSFISISSLPNLNTEEGQLGLLLVVIASAFLVTGIVKGLCRLFKRKPKTEVVEVIKTTNVNLNKAETAMDFLERLIKDKYTYYMYLELLPIYLANNIPEKNVIKKIKEKIYVSVVGSLTRPVKEEMLKFFTEKGVEIFVNEQIIILMNETDFRSAGKFTEAFRELNVNTIDQIL